MLDRENNSPAPRLAGLALCPQQVELLTAIHAAAEIAPKTTADVLSVHLDQLRAGEPVPPFQSLEVEADNWASVAHVGELSAYAVASLKRLKTRAFPISDRKRVLCAIWETLPPDDRIGFLRRVDPQGKFMRKGGV